MKNIKLDINFSKFIIKPILATFMMGIVSLYTYNYLIRIITENMAIIITLMIAGVIYFLSIISLKIFDKEEICMLPFGKIYIIFWKK